MCIVTVCLVGWHCLYVYNLSDSSWIKLYKYQYWSTYLNSFVNQSRKGRQYVHPTGNKTLIFLSCDLNLLRLTLKDCDQPHQKNYQTVVCFCSSLLLFQVDKERMRKPMWKFIMLFFSVSAEATPALEINKTSFCFHISLKSFSVPSILEKSIGKVFSKKKIKKLKSKCVFHFISILYFYFIFYINNYWVFYINNQ